MLSFATNFGAALQSLREQKARAALSALGILVGSLAIILLVSIAKGVEADIRGQVEDLGVNLLIVLPGRVSDGAMFNASMVGISQLREDLADEVKNVKGVRDAVPLTFVGGGIRNGVKTSPSTLAIAVRPGWFDMRKIKLRSGRVFNNQDEFDPVCVIGGIANDKLFGETSGVGRKLALNGVIYTVVGVTSDKKSEQSLFSAGSFENVVYVPFKFLQQHVPEMQIDRIMIQTDADVEPKSLIQKVERVIGRTVDHESYSVLTQEDLLRLVYKIMGILSWLLIGLTSIALFVGGVGIMTIMLMSVNERSKEIGIRKTVGARRGDIFQQFLSEAVVLALIGGTAGLLLSYAVCVGLYYYTPIKPMITLATVAMSFGVSTTVGAVFGLVPAMKAAKRDPVDALRHE